MTTRIQQIAALRQKTQASFKECAMAYEEAEGDSAMALAILDLVLKHRGERQSLSNSKADVCTIMSYNHQGRICAVVECSAQTSFVLASEPFQRFMANLVQHIAGYDFDNGVHSTPEHVATLLATPWIKDPTQTIHDMLSKLSGLTGERIEIRRFLRWEAGV